MVYAANDIGHIAEHNRLLGVPFGTLGYAQNTALSQTVTTGAAITSLTSTVTVGSGRRIRVTGRVGFSTTVAADAVLLQIVETATQLEGFAAPLPTTGLPYGVMTSVVLTPSAGAHTYFLQAVRSAGTGVITATGTATAKAWILVEDIGV